MPRILKILAINCVLVSILGGTVYILIGYAAYVLSIDNPTLQSFFKISLEENDAIKTGNWLFLLPRTMKFLPGFIFSQTLFATLLLKGKILGSHKLEQTKRGRKLLNQVHTMLNLN
jgi:hypothetical protein